MRTIKALSRDDRKILANKLPRLRAISSKMAGASRGQIFKLVDADGRSVDIDRSTAMAILRALALASLTKGLSCRTARGFTPRQAGEILEMSRPTIMRYINRGELTASKVNTHFRISSEAVEEFASKRGERRQALDRIAALSERYDF